MTISATWPLLSNVVSFNLSNGVQLCIGMTRSRIFCPIGMLYRGVIASLAFNDAVLWRGESHLISNQVHIGTRRPSDIIDLDMKDALIQVRNGIFSSENRFIRINHYFPL